MYNNVHWQQTAENHNQLISYDFCWKLKRYSLDKSVGTDIVIWIFWNWDDKMMGTENEKSSHVTMCRKQKMLIIGKT